MSDLPDSLGEYAILRKLGAGGMGEVYLAQDHRLGRRVAIKLLPDRLQTDETARLRLLREAKSAAALEHPNVCPIYHIGEDAGRTFVVMQFIEGETLSQRIRRQPMSLEEVLRLGIEIGGALREAHSKGIVHRDIKPANIMLDTRGRAQVLDFGLAKPLANAVHSSTDLALSEVGTVSGTVGYMSPEQLTAEPLDGRSDLFSLGIVLWQAATGEHPFDRKSDAGTIVAILTAEPAPLPHTLAMLGPVLRACLAKDLPLRAPSAEWVVDALEETSKRVRSGQETRPADSEQTATFAVQPGRPASTDLQSIAILPLSYETSAADAELLADGLTAGFIDAMARETDLRVLARSSVFRFKGIEVDPRLLREELGVDLILCGTVTGEGGERRLEIELIDARDGVRLLGERYALAGADPSKLQRMVVSAVAARTGARVERSGASGPVRDIESPSFQAFLRGQHHWNRRTPQTVRQSLEHFQEAIDLDPTFGAGWNGVADCYTYFGFFEMLPPMDMVPRARAAAQRALQLDPRIAEAHATLGFLSSMFDWDWGQGDVQFLKALEVNGNCAIAAHWYGLSLIFRRRFDEAIPWLDRAIQLDPLSPIMATIRAYCEYARGNAAGAISRFENILATEPRFMPVYHYAGIAYGSLGRFADAISTLEKMSDLSHRSPLALGLLGHAMASGGRSEEAGQLLEELEQRRSSEYISSLQMALICFGLDRREQGLDLLRQAAAEHSPWLCQIQFDYRFDRVRHEPAFEEVRRRLFPG